MRRRFGGNGGEQPVAGAGEGFPTLYTKAVQAIDMTLRDGTMRRRRA
jgi:hypothetical protein